MMKKVTAGIVVALLLLLALGCSSGPETGPGEPAPYYEGDGRAGIRIAVLELQGVDLTLRDQAVKLTSQIQSDLTTSFQRYSAMTVLDREHQDAIEGELVRSEQGRSPDEGHLRRGEELHADVIVTGTVTSNEYDRTYKLELTCIDVVTGEHVGGSSLSIKSANDLYGRVPLREAAAEILLDLGVPLTGDGRTALTNISPAEINADVYTVLAQDAKRRNPEGIDVRFYYYLAATYDPSLMATANLHALVEPVNLDTGSAGANVRADAAWKDAWRERLIETEDFFTKFFEGSIQPYAIVYAEERESGARNYNNVTRSLSFLVDLKEYVNWTEAVENTVRSVWNGLKATGQESDWGFASWPQTPVSSTTPFRSGRKSFTVDAVLENPNNVIGEQSFSLDGSWSFDYDSQGEMHMSSSTSGLQRVSFSGLNSETIIDPLKIRLTKVNGVFVDEIDIDSEDALVVATRADYRDTEGHGYDYVYWYKTDTTHDFAKIWGGTFMMGSLASETGRLLREGPRHQVTVPTFYIGKYEVTQAQYQEVMGKNPSYFKDSIRPVENVSWLDAIAYCNARSVKEGLTPAYTVSGATVTWNQTVNGYRLPTEAEWEYACRAGTTTPYSSGDSVDAAGWYHGWLSGPFFKGINDGLNTVAYWLFGFGLFPSEEGKTHPVGSKQANGWGLYDMHGNVAEWCWDRYGAYGIAAQTNPTTGLSSGGSRVRRGGSWRESEANLRSASRDFSGMSLRDINIGFRVVRP